MNSPITTHILDTSAGRPAAGVKVELRRGDASEAIVATAETDADGRVEKWSPSFEIQAGEYTLSFAVGDYFTTRNESSFYSIIQISFLIESIDEHYHVPLLLNPFSYSTYRGS